MLFTEGKSFRNGPVFLRGRGIKFSGGRIGLFRRSQRAGQMQCFSSSFATLSRQRRTIFHSFTTLLNDYESQVLQLIEIIMLECIPKARASRDFRVKFPDDVIQENLSGQLWFGAEVF